MTTLSTRLLAATLALAFCAATPAAQAAPQAAAAPAPALTRISVEVRGTAGSDVILIPGLSSTRHVFDAAARALAQQHRVHLVQVRGFGEPAGANATGPVLAPVVAEIAAYARSLRRPAVVAGHSFGGLAAMMVGLAARDAVTQVVVIDALPFFGTAFGVDSVAALQPRAVQMRDAVLAQAAGSTPDFGAPDCAAAQGPIAEPKGNMSNSLAGQCQMMHGMRASDGRVVAQALYDDMTTDLRPQVAALGDRLTVLYAQDDRLMTAAQADAIYAAAYASAPQAQRVRIENSYHFIMQDQPARLLAELRKILGGR